MVQTLSSSHGQFAVIKWHEYIRQRGGGRTAQDLKELIKLMVVTFT